MKEELNKILKELNEVTTESNLKVSDYEFLDLGVRIYLTDKINKQKQFYPKNEFRNDFSKTNPLTKSDEKPTEAQIKAMKKLNLPIPAGSSKKDVWKIMNENKK